MKFPYQIGIPSTVHDNDGNDNNNYNNIGKKYFSLPSTFQTEFHPNSCFHYHSMNSLHNNNERIAVCHHNHYQHQHHHHHYNSDWTNRRPWTILILIINIIFVSIIIGSTEAIQSE
ncbi:hypothetical protein DERF_002076 [Dermatophagoides farinae]|uniref:Uncharacterized protein n=1 Tax=Dermatophagoides farinae TaxID=6954 RepID=A0A922IDM2_DERFA|nr:hypothetical protein DERF_002076 [Dermatophagoides farinae]